MPRPPWQESPLENHVRFVLPLLSTLLVLVLAACGSEPTQSVPPASEAASTAAAASQAASAPASSEPSTGGGNGTGSLDCAALEALMPASLGDSSISTTCLSGEEIMQAGGSVPLDELEDAGVELRDAAIAIGTGTDGSSGVFLYSLPGADADAFRDQMARGLEAGQVVSGEFSSASIGGKDVLKAEGIAGVASNYYLYVADDLLAWILAPDDDSAAEVLAGLP
jgi:hypothetical protein